MTFPHFSSFFRPWQSHAANCMVRLQGPNLGVTRTTRDMGSDVMAPSQTSWLSCLGSGDESDVISTSRLWNFISTQKENTKPPPGGFARTNKNSQMTRVIILVSRKFYQWQMVHVQILNQQPSCFAHVVKRFARIGSAWTLMKLEPILQRMLHAIFQYDSYNQYVNVQQKAFHSDSHL